jgi:transcriptional antiterminator Rof (Rho-off)
MSLTLHIHDTSKPEVKAFLDYVRSLKFVEIEEETIALEKDQIEAIEEARMSYEKLGGKTTSEVLDKMKKKHPKAFKS